MCTTKIPPVPIGPLSVLPMECAGCRVPKLSAEFPSAALVAAGCPMRRCLRCIRAGGSGSGGGGGPDPALVTAELAALWCPGPAAGDLPDTI